MKKQLIGCLLITVMILGGCGKSSDTVDEPSSISAEESEDSAVELTKEEEYAIQVINHLLDEIDDPSSLNIYSMQGTDNVMEALANNESAFDMYKNVKMEYVVTLDCSYSNESGGQERYKDATGYVGTDVGFDTGENEDLTHMNFFIGFRTESVKNPYEFDVDRLLENSNYYNYVKK